MRLDKQAFIRAMGWSFTLATIETFWWEVMWGMMREVCALQLSLLFNLQQIYIRLDQFVWDAQHRLAATWARTSKLILSRVSQKTICSTPSAP